MAVEIQQLTTDKFNMVGQSNLATIANIGDSSKFAISNEMLAH